MKNGLPTKSHAAHSGSTAVTEPWYSGPQRLGTSPRPYPPHRGTQSAAVSPASMAYVLAILASLANESLAQTSLPLQAPVAAYATPPWESRRTKAEEAIALLDEWLADESGYDEETWPELKQALDQDRLSDRRFFDA